MGGYMPGRHQTSIECYKLIKWMQKETAMNLLTQAASKIPSSNKSS